MDDTLTAPDQIITLVLTLHWRSRAIALQLRAFKVGRREPPGLAYNYTLQLSTPCPEPTGAEIGHQLALSSRPVFSSDQLLGACGDCVQSVMYVVSRYLTFHYGLGAGSHRRRTAATSPSLTRQACLRRMLAERSVYSSVRSSVVGSLGRCPGSRGWTRKRLAWQDGLYLSVIKSANRVDCEEHRNKMLYVTDKVSTRNTDELLA
ncbi:hypothetical protein C0Q70_00808 [Pomacea canaliculata]|uniref:Uncharacterized protein n=1 Tax=Pomacea canaliculata TaxID=400727 RepID=A0A2T7PXT4_POMCA|nr:hypothetical protein C0Q70_00808 [Pomacea canaliculata]